jgi:hypothetical protein
MKPQRYYWVNFLNLFFSPIGTAEFRIHEGSTNFTKVACWLLVCASILKYAEKIKVCFKTKNITLKEVILDNCGESLTSYIMDYLELRNKTFFKSDGLYKDNSKSIEKRWFEEDPAFKFVKNGTELI